MSKPLKHDHPPAFQLEFFLCLASVLAAAVYLFVVAQVTA